MNSFFDFLKPSRQLRIKNCSALGDGMTLFVPEGYDPNQTPSLAFVKPLVETTESVLSTNHHRWSPQFFIKGSFSITTLTLPPKVSLYGTGEVTGPLLRNGKHIELWNTDNLKYQKAGGRRLYQSHPWVLGVREDGSAFGILFDTTWKASLKTDHQKIIFKSAGGPCRVVVIDRASPQGVLQGLATLTGTMALPPKWALGFHQSRYSYYPDSKVREIANEYRSRKLPCDGIWMDIHYMDGYRIFSFHPEHFPDAQATNDYLHQQGFHSVWMIDPGVKVDPHDPIYQSGSSHRAWVTTKTREEFQGEVWPGMCTFPDFTVPEVRTWWSKHYEDFISKGVDGVWNDMNEPAVFKTKSGTMPEDNQHRGGGLLPAGPHAMYHNVYGMLMTMATREGMLQSAPTKRPFVLTRANYIGGQRYAATWTGDNASSMKFLKMSLPMSLNLGLSGQAFSGPDLGGFFGKITPDLFGKWISMAPFFPFARAHTDVSNPEREPWSFGPAIERVSRTSLERRYRLLPYLYTLAYYASLQGDLIMQPLFFADSQDQHLRKEDRAFLLGSDLLVIPAWSQKSYWGMPKPLALPRGAWREVHLLEENVEEDGYQARLKIRPGAIIPLGEVIQHSGASSSVLTLLTNLDAEGKASGTLYEDAGDGFGYLDGEYLLTRFEASYEGKRLEIKKVHQAGTMKSSYKEVRVKLVGEEYLDLSKKALSTAGLFYSGFDDISVNHDQHLGDEW
ncbi:MAG: TIM-barrel domain-containing protein [Chthoniobacterales bacterium]